MSERRCAASSVSEDIVIQTLADRFPSHPELQHLGIGDDTAWLRDAGWDLVTCDLMCEDTHFDLALSSWFDVGWRCLAANLSDIAAMGGQPGPFTLGLGLGEGGASLASISALADGLRACLDAHGDATSTCTLVGGDVVRARHGLVLSITLMGRAPQPAPLRRRGARVGDVLVVFRPLGDSAAGLVALQRGLGTDPALQPLIEAFARPRVDLQLGQLLAGCELEVAALDLSDGLWRDAARFSDANGAPLGARIDIDALPVSTPLSEAATRLGLVPWKLAACGGEDYTLCAALTRDRLDALCEATAASGVRPFVVGELVRRSGVRFVRAGLPIEAPRGFEHFSGARDVGDHEHDEHQS